MIVAKTHHYSELDYFASALPEKGSQFFVLDHLSSCEMGSSINENQCWSRLRSEVEIGGCNSNFDLCLALDSRGFQLRR
jgi:hypothetical protein